MPDAAKLAQIRQDVSWLTGPGDGDYESAPWAGDVERVAQAVSDLCDALLADGGEASA